MPKGRTKTVRRAKVDQMNDLYRTWARNRWPAGMPDDPDWSDVETAFQAGFYLALTEGDNRSGDQSNSAKENTL